MPARPTSPDAAAAALAEPIDQRIGADARALSAQLALLRNRIFPPAAQKTLRRFSSGEAGGRLDYDFLRYLVTRYEPQDGPQTQVVGFLRSLFGDRVLTNPMVKSTAISDAGLTKQTLYEVGPQNFSRETYNRATEALDAVNAEIQGLVTRAWGRSAK